MTFRAWLDHPEHVWVRHFMFQLHFWIGAAATLWVVLISMTGAVLVFRDEISRVASIDWVLRLHTTLLAGRAGAAINTAGAFALLVLCVTGAVIWWPGVAHWRRSLTVDWAARLPRISWDAHSALGVWFFVFVLVWGLSGLYLVQPHLFDFMYRLDPRDRVADQILFSLSTLHFGRFTLTTQIIWGLTALVPAALAVTGAFVCCRRVVFKSPANPKHSVRTAGNHLSSTPGKAS